jgi:hypothetical protein
VPIETVAREARVTRPIVHRLPRMSIAALILAPAVVQPRAHR